MNVTGLCWLVLKTAQYAFTMEVYEQHKLSMDLHSLVYVHKGSTREWLLEGNGFKIIDSNWFSCTFDVSLILSSSSSWIFCVSSWHCRESNSAWLWRSESYYMIIKSVPRVQCTEENLCSLDSMTWEIWLYKDQRQVSPFNTSPIKDSWM